MTMKAKVDMQVGPKWASVTSVVFLYTISFIHSSPPLKSLGPLTLPHVHNGRIDYRSDILPLNARESIREEYR